MENIEKHPFEHFIPTNAYYLVIGTFPPSRFVTHNLELDDVNFYYGSRDNYFWETISEIYSLNLSFNKDDINEVKKRKDFLVKYKIGISDIIEECTREKKNASDQNLKVINYRKIIDILIENPTIETIFFTSGSGKINAESLFFQYLYKAKVAKGIRIINKKPPKKKEFVFKTDSIERLIKTITLYSPSANARRGGVTPEKKNTNVQRVFAKIKSNIIGLYVLNIFQLTQFKTPPL